MIYIKLQLDNVGIIESKPLISDTPFEDGTFRLTIEFTEEYPNKPPTVKFVSKMFHPNVYSDGSLCLDILQNRFVLISSSYILLPAA